MKYLKTHNSITDCHKLYQRRRMKKVILLLMEVGSCITHFLSEMDSAELMSDIKLPLRGKTA